MSGVARGVRLLVASVLLGYPVSVSAQTSSVAYADLLGSWEQVLEQKAATNSQPLPLIFMGGTQLIHRRITFLPNNALRLTQINVSDATGDTVSCSQLRPLIQMGDTLRNPGQGILWRGVVEVKGPQLVWRYVYHNGQVVTTFKRIDPSQHPLNRVIATGFASNRPAPVRAATPTGTLADLIGVWEQLPNPDWPQQGAIRKTQLVFPDTTTVEIDVSKAGEDTLACGHLDFGGFDPRSWRRAPGDSLITNVALLPTDHWRAVFQGSRITIYNRSETPKVYQPGTFAKQP